MEDALSRKLGHLMAVRNLKRRETTNVKWLEKVRRMWRHTERNNLVLCTELIELRRSVAAMAIKDKQPVGPYCTRLCVSVEVLHPLKAKLVSRSAVVTDCDSPARW
jgi:hypothetical protein